MVKLFQPLSEENIYFVFTFKSCFHWFSKLTVCFFFQYFEDISPLSSFLHFFPDMKFPVFIISFLTKCNRSFFLHLLFTFFYLSLTLSKLTSMYLSSSLLPVFFPPLLGAFSASRINGFIVLNKFWGGNLALISLKIFCTLSPSGTLITYILV